MPDLPQVNYRGKLKKIDDKHIVLDLYDGRTASFQRSGKTKFYKESKEVKSSELYLGDPVSIDAAEDPQAFLNALRVTFDSSPPPSGVQGASQANAAGGTAPWIQYDDKGRPTLKRRGPLEQEPGEAQEAPGAGQKEIGDRDQETSEPPGASIPSASPGVPAGDGLPGRPLPSSGMGTGTSPPPDPWIEKARAAAAASSGTLPNFICQEVMARSTRESNESGWKAADEVSTDVIYAGGRETHRDLKIDGRPAEENTGAMAGAWPIRTLLATQSDLFSPATQARFRFGGDSNLPNLAARVYDFDVAAETSQWTMRMGPESINAAYSGSVWIDKESGRVLRLEIQARDLPPGFPLVTVEASVEYGLVHFGPQAVLLPMHVETTGCPRGGQACSRNVIDFRNYRPSTAEAKHP